MTSPAVNAFDMLLVNQLESLLHEEDNLKARYSALGAPLASSEARHDFTHQLSVLRDRADRLNRLLDAMNVHGMNASELAA